MYLKLIFRKRSQSITQYGNHPMTLWTKQTLNLYFLLLVQVAMKIILIIHYTELYQEHFFKCDSHRIQSSSHQNRLSACCCNRLRNSRSLADILYMVFAHNIDDHINLKSNEFWHEYKCTQVLKRHHYTIKRLTLSSQSSQITQRQGWAIIFPNYILWHILFLSRKLWNTLFTQAAEWMGQN